MKIVMFVLLPIFLSYMIALILLKLENKEAIKSTRMNYKSLIGNNSIKYENSSEQMSNCMEKAEQTLQRYNIEGFSYKKLLENNTM